MKYYFEKPSYFVPIFGKTYFCNHPIYNKCTLFIIGDKGLAVIQQRFNPKDKTTWWGEIDPWLINPIYIKDGFKSYFDKYAGEAVNGLYPTVTIRQIMWALRMKPIKREVWETVFDKKPI